MEELNGTGRDGWSRTASGRAALAWVRGRSLPAAHAHVLAVHCLPNTFSGLGAGRKSEQEVVEEEEEASMLAAGSCMSGEDHAL